jgi:hypothetical protein
VTDYSKLKEEASICILRGIPLMDVKPATIFQMTAKLKQMEEVLTWYAEKVAGCQKITSEGDDARRALDHDGGQLARTALENSHD